MTNPNPRWTGAAVFVDVENLFHHVVHPDPGSSPAVLHPKPTAADVAQGCHRLLNRLVAWAGDDPALAGTTPELILVGKESDPTMVGVASFGGAKTQKAGQLANSADALLLSTIFARASTGRFRRWVVASADGQIIKGFQVAAALLTSAHSRDTRSARAARPEFFIVTPPGKPRLKDGLEPGNALAGTIQAAHLRCVTDLPRPSKVRKEPPADA